MRRTLVIILILLLLAMGLPRTAAASDPDESRLTMTPDGLYWTDDMRVTTHSAADTIPQITVDKNHDAHIFWMRDGWYYKKFDRFGNALTKEKQINTQTTTQFLSEKVVDIDSNQDIHFVWVPGGYSGEVHYVKYDNEGNVLIPEMTAVENVQSTHVPNMAVSSDDAVNIIYEDYRYQCEDINYNKLLDGKIIKDAICISNDVASHCEFCNIATDRYNTVYANFGSNTGSWIGAINSEGVHPWASSQLPITTSYQTAGMACTPDMHVHIAWFEAGVLYYQRYNQQNIAVTEPIEIDSGNLGDHAVWSDLRNPGIATDSANNIVITYTKDDMVYYKYIKHRTWNDTQSGGYKLIDKTGCRRPRVAIDPDDNVHIVWEDTRSGNKEIYYKFAYNFQLKLYADPVDLQNMFYFHPNETKVLPFELQNTGGIADKYDVTLNTDDISETWTIELNNTYCELAGESSEKFKMTVHSPEYAAEGDNTYINITAVSRGNPEKNDMISFIAFIIVTHDVSLTCRNPVNTVYPGKSVSYNLFVTNIGDVPERIKVIGLIGAPMGWDYEIIGPQLDDMGVVHLEPKQGTNLTVHVYSPEDAKANDNATVTIQAYDMDKPEASANVILRTLVTPIFYLLWEAEVTERWIDPGATDHFEMKLTNYGNVVGAAQISVEIASDLRGWDAFLDKEQVQLRGGESTIIKLTVTVPDRALAGQRLVLRTVAETFELTQKAQIETTAFVNIIHDIQPDLETDKVDVYPGGEATYLVELYNNGNGEDRIDLFVEGGQPGWVVTFEYQDLEVNKIIVSPLLSKTLTVVVQTPYEAEAGVFDTKIVLRDSGGNDYEVSVRTEVRQVYNIDLTCSQVHQKGTPGGVLIYPMTLENLGNGLDIVNLDVTSIPDGWTYRFIAAGGSEIEGDSLNIAYGERLDFKLNVWVADNHMETEETLTVKAQSMDAAQQDQIQLTAEIRMPDLRIQSVEFNPQNIRENKVVQIRVQLENIGTGGANDVLVEFYDNGKFISDDAISYITTGITGNATAVFTWLPKAGKHNLKFVVDPPLTGKPNGRVLESAEDNNDLMVTKNASGKDKLPGPSFSLVLMAFLGVAILAGSRGRKR
jgi:uncharacterized membrane protein